MTDPKLSLAEIHERLKELPGYEIFFEGDGDEIYSRFVRDIPRMLSTLQTACALANASRRLVSTLHQCNVVDEDGKCTRPATRRSLYRGGARFCDQHGPNVSERPSAQPLRDTIEALAELDKT